MFINRKTGVSILFVAMLVLIFLGREFFLPDADMVQVENNIERGTVTDDTSGSRYNNEYGVLSPKPKISSVVALDDNVVASTKAAINIGGKLEDIPTKLLQAIVRNTNSNLTGYWVKVDCINKLVLKCPHGPVLEGISPIAVKQDRKFLIGRCADLSIDTVSFCGF